jgi:hypothetical protein
MPRLSYPPQYAVTSKNYEGHYVVFSIHLLFPVKSKNSFVHFVLILSCLHSIYPCLTMKINFDVNIKEHGKIFIYCNSETTLHFGRIGSAGQLTSASLPLMLTTKSLSICAVFASISERSVFKSLFIFEHYTTCTPVILCKMWAITLLTTSQPAWLMTDWYHTTCCPRNQTYGQ